MIKEWRDPPDVEVSAAYREAVSGHPLVAKILKRRGYEEIREALAFLNPVLYTPADPTDLPDLAEAAERLRYATQHKERILVWGDFDVDGQTATALLVDGLRRAGAKVEFHVPHRMQHGHGVHTEVLRDYFGRVDLLLTCDTGIAAHDAMDAAKVNGLPVIITDHHALPPSLPDAPQIVNPQRLPPEHPLRDLPGVGVSYLLIRQLYALLNREEEAEDLLDLVALGIVCDVANQRRDTRYLLQLGIDELRHPKRPGLQVLMEVAGVVPTALSADTIGFQIGPRLNAVGRLSDAAQAVEMLTTESVYRARTIAERLELLNQQRKQIENQIYAAAQDQIAKEPSLLDFEALVLAAPAWHPGVIGIVASRLVEQYGKPTVLITIPKEGPAGGSARSVPGVDIGACIAAQSDILVRHGGHPGAAGLTLDPDLIPAFRRRLSNTVRDTRDTTVQLGYTIDATVSLAECSMELAEQLNRLAPFGAGNPPVLLRIPNLRTVTHRGFGANYRHRRVTVADEEGREFDITWWRGSEHAVPETKYDLLVIPRINDYRGSRSLQLEWVDYRAVPGDDDQHGPLYTIVDVRSSADPLGEAALPDESLIWAEAMEVNGSGLDETRIIRRDTDREARTLVIWSVPPGPAETRQLVEEVGARTLHVAAKHRPDDEPESFLRRLAGLVNYALTAYAGEVSLVQLAGATGQREITVRRGLEALAADGKLTLDWLADDRVRIAKGGAVDETARDDALSDLYALLAEAAAFRRYFQQAKDLEAFFQRLTLDPT